MGYGIIQSFGRMELMATVTSDTMMFGHFGVFIRGRYESFNFQRKEICGTYITISFKLHKPWRFQEAFGDGIYSLGRGVGEGNLGWN